MDILAAALVRLGAACVSGVTLLLRMVFALTPPSRFVAGTLCCAVAATAVAAGADAEAQKRSYRLPHGEAATILAQFATESGRPILYMMDQVRGEQTNALAGSYAPREALDRLLAGTALVAVHDPKSGGFIVNRRAAPSKQEQAEKEKVRGPPGENAAPPSAPPKTAQSHHNEPPPVKPTNFFALFSKNCSAHEFSITGPSTVELALGISSGSRYWLLYQKYYPKYCTIVIRFPSLTMYRSGIEKRFDGQFISPSARYVLKQ